MKPSVPFLTFFLAGLSTFAPAQTAPAPAQAEAKEAKPPLLRSSEDGWLDLSGFIDQAYGFLPVLMPVTEPAVGYGAGVAAMFLDKPKPEAGAGFGRPNITVLGVLATENGTRGGAVGDIRHWLGDRLQTTVGVFKASVNLDFYGVGRDDAQSSHPLRFTLEPLGGLARAKLRLGNSRTWAGLSYFTAAIDVSYTAPEQWPTDRGFEKTSRVGALVPSLSFDSRDNIFTPTKGTYADLQCGVFRQALGGSNDFERDSGVVIQYVRLGPTVTIGLRGDAVATWGDTPFYMLPYVSLRGAPAMRYQGNQVASVETEARWQCWRRFSLVGFAGTGSAWRSTFREDTRESVRTGGAGFRYELARKYGVHAGVDVANGPDGYAVYVQVGSAWARP
jgi:outer membrane protein assembly factor BamA